MIIQWNLCTEYTALFCHKKNAFFKQKAAVSCWYVWHQQETADRHWPVAGNKN